MAEQWEHFQVLQEETFAPEIRQNATEKLTEKVLELVGGDDESHIKTIVEYIEMVLFDTNENMKQLASMMTEILGDADSALGLAKWIGTELKQVLRPPSQSAKLEDQTKLTSHKKTNDNDPEVPVDSGADSKAKAEGRMTGSLSSGRDSRKRPRDDSTVHKGRNQMQKHPSNESRKVASMYRMYIASGFDGDFHEYESYLGRGSRGRGRGGFHGGPRGPPRGLPRGPPRGRGNGFVPRGFSGGRGRGGGGVAPRGSGRPPAANMQWSRAVDGDKEDKLSAALPTGREDFVPPEPDYNAAYADFGMDSSGEPNGKDWPGAQQAGQWASYRGRGRGGFAPRGYAPYRGGYRGRGRGRGRPGAFGQFQNKQWVREESTAQPSTSAELSQSLPVTPPRE